MNKYLATFTIIFCCTALSGAEFLRPRNPMTLVGSIQFPPSVKDLPSLRVYRSGNIIPCEYNSASNKVSFTIMDDRSQIQFSLLITEALSFQTEENTVQCIKIDPRKNYKFYVLTLKEIIPTQTQSTQTQQQPEYTWIIKEVSVDFNGGRIPDDTIIVCYNPSFVEELRGGNAIALPTIVIKPDILKLVGSEVQLHESSAKLLLSSLDYDALHSHSRTQVRQDFANKTIMTITT